MREPSLLELTKIIYIVVWLVVCMSANTVFELVADQRSATDHLANGEDAVRLESVDAELSPVTLGQDLCPV